jgi:hypothetical protein
LLLASLLPRVRRECSLYVSPSPAFPCRFVNVSSAQLKIPLYIFAPSVMLGLTPYNFLACKAGLILSELTSRSDIINSTNTLQVRMRLLLRASSSAVCCGPRLRYPPQTCFSRLSDRVARALFPLQLVGIAVVGFLLPSIASRFTAKKPAPAKSD